MTAETTGHGPVWSMRIEIDDPDGRTTRIRVVGDGPLPVAPFALGGIGTTGARVREEVRVDGERDLAAEDTGRVIVLGAGSTLRVPEGWRGETLVAVPADAHDHAAIALPDSRRATLHPGAAAWVRGFAFGAIHIVDATPAMAWPASRGAPDTASDAGGDSGADADGGTGTGGSARGGSGAVEVRDPSVPDSAARPHETDEIFRLWRSRKKNTHLPYLISAGGLGWDKDPFRRHRDILGWDVEITVGYGHEHANTWIDLAGGEPLDDLSVRKGKHLSPRATTAAMEALEPRFLDMPVVWVSSPGLPHEYCIQVRYASGEPMQYWNPYKKKIYTPEEAAEVWRRVAKGEFDRYYRACYARWARMLAEGGRDTRLVCIDLMPEMSGTWKTVNPGPDLVAYKDAWRRIVDILRDSFERHGTGRPLVAWRPARTVFFGDRLPGRTLEEYAKVRPNLWDAFPGEDWVDVTATELHNPTPLATREQWEEYVFSDRRSGTNDGVAVYLDWVVANTRRTMIGFTEWGYFAKKLNFWPALADPSKAFAWTRELFDRYGDRILFAVYSSWGAILADERFRKAMAEAFGPR